jgi:hypothetical protein
MSPKDSLKKGTLNKKKKNDSKNHMEKQDPLLTVTAKQQKTIDKMLKESVKSIDQYWSEEKVTQTYVPIDNGELRVFYHKPKEPLSKRPVVFVPGWGVIPSGFNDLYEVLIDEVEFYYIETREKCSSRMNKKKVSFTMTQKAKDVQDVLNFLNLSKHGDFILAGPCWGAAIILQGLLDGLYADVPTIITADPMHKLWFPKAILNLAKFIPTFVVKLIRPILKYLFLKDMDEEVQKQRAEDFVDNAELWKWKRAAYHVRDFELFGKLDGISREVFVFNGATDKIHDQICYPRMAKEIPKGRFFFMNADEADRERILALFLREFSKVLSDEEPPAKLKEFEKDLERTN